MSRRKYVVALSSSSETHSDKIDGSTFSGKSPSFTDDLELLDKVDSLDLSEGKDVEEDGPTGGLELSAIELFSSKACLNWESCVVEGSPEAHQLRKCVNFGETYTCHFPSSDDRIWISPGPGWQAVPSIFFSFGLRVPMHPFLPLLFEALGCGYAQLSPNSFAQVMGFIARCHEHKVLPSLELLFAIFRVKSIGGQVYLDKKTGRQRLVKVPLSNSGWQAKWAYLEGGEFAKMRPWTVVPRSRMMTLSEMPHSLSSSFLSKFHGPSELYSINQFAKASFLSERCCKIRCFVCCRLFSFYRSVVAL